MHEFSIAINIIDIVTDAAESQGAKKVNEIELEIGDLSGVVYEAMEMAMESAVSGTWLENTNITITRIKGKAKCSQCGKMFSIDNLFDQCPECGAFNPVIQSGKELKVKSLQVE
nr:hydrogenase maturation nickel metallochaperone HypA [Bacteroidota bacterium]